MLNPLGMINDGFMELVFFGNGYVTAAGAINLFCMPHGKMFYEDGFICYRCKSAKLVNKTVDPITNNKVE